MPPLASPGDLCHERLLLLGQGEEPYESQWASVEGRREQVTLQACAWGSDLEGLISLARHGAGIVMAPDFCVEGIALLDAQHQIIRLPALQPDLHEVLPGWRLLLGVETVQALTLPIPAGSETARALVRYVRQALGSAL